MEVAVEQVAPAHRAVAAAGGVTIIGTVALVQAAVRAQRARSAR